MGFDLLFLFACNVSIELKRVVARGMRIMLFSLAYYAMLQCPIASPIMLQETAYYACGLGLVLRHNLHTPSCSCLAYEAIASLARA